MGGETSIDGLILTHLDADHCNGAAQLMARVQVRRLFLPEQESDSRKTILTAAEPLRHGDRLCHGGPDA